MNLQKIVTFVLLGFSFLAFSQQTKIVITGKIVEKQTNTPLEYATAIFKHKQDAKKVFGATANEKGMFSVEIVPGTYDVSFEFLSFKNKTIANQTYTESKSLGTIFLEEEATSLKEVEVVAERTTVELKLDKKIYNVGKDMLVKGGTASDVLDNVPSVSVDVEGNVSMRGNENVKILIDGKPSGLAGINVAEALKQLPADSVEKVEVITNPSSRYEAEGGAGIINIVLRKGKANGLNGSVILSVGEPANNGISASFNKRTDHFNFFTNSGYSYRKNPGNFLFDSQYFNSNGTSRGYVYEDRKLNRKSDGYNVNLGFDWNLDEKRTAVLTNSFSIRENDGESAEDVIYYNYDANYSPLPTTYRNNYPVKYSKDKEFATNFIKKFKKDEHQLTFDFSYSENIENEVASIFDAQNGNDRNTNMQNQNRKLFQTDYVLPLGKNSRFEIGYRGSFQNNNTFFDTQNQPLYRQNLEYKEYINAAYSQFGSKIDKISYFLGVRYEHSDIHINSLLTNNFNNKKYGYFFPTATLGYTIDDSKSASISYSKRINRPRGRFLQPITTFTSAINVFQGNPSIDPSLTDAFDISFLKRWKNVSLNTSAYVNFTTDAFLFIRKESGNFTPSGTPIMINTPINLATERNYGFEFTLNYSPYKWWKLNGNFNFFRNETNGDYTYSNYLSQPITQNFDNEAYTWFTRINSKITLPYKIDFQLKGTYNAPQTNAQGKSLGVAVADLAFSKDVLKDKGTIALNASDLFNTRKRRVEVYIPNSLKSYSEMQFRERQITLSFTYRFNQSKKEKENTRKPKQEGGGDDMIMG